jgi:integrase/recombinase XerD
MNPGEPDPVADGRPGLAGVPATALTGDALAAAVAALPALPPAAPGDRYAVRRLTAAWLAELRSRHTQRAYFRDLAGFLGWCQQQRLDPLALRPTDIGQYKVWLQLPGSGRRRTARTPATVARALAALSSWYAYLVANDQVRHTRVPGARPPLVPRHASTTAGLTLAEVNALLDAADSAAEARADTPDTQVSPARQARYLAALRDRALLRLLADLGLRVGEALGLDVAALTYNRGQRTLRYRGKGNKLRERPLAAHTLEAVDEYLVARARVAGVSVGQLGGPLFATTGPHGAGRLDEPAAFRLIRRLARRAGIPHADRLSPHSLRHAWATTAREQRVPLENVQDAMGHADPRTTRRYDRARHALTADPALALGALHADRQSGTRGSTGSGH